MVDSEPPSKLSLNEDDTKAISPDVQPPTEDIQSNPIEKNPQDDGVEYLTGLKLAVVVASVALSCFLMLLDNLIVSTVSRLQVSICVRVLELIRLLGNSAHHRQVPFTSRYWLVR
jgi:hypothetical protein